MANKNARRKYNRVHGTQKLIKASVSKKWPDAEQKKWWYSKFTAARRHRLAKQSEAQNHRCCYCGVKTWLASEGRPDGAHKDDLATYEHIHPLTKGGLEHPSNLAMACYACNNMRGSMDPIEFYEIRANKDRFKKYLRDNSKIRQLRSASNKEKSIEKRMRSAYRHAVCAVTIPGYDLLLAEMVRLSNERLVFIEDQFAERNKRNVFHNAKERLNV